jgi:hypothetical protein
VVLEGVELLEAVVVLAGLEPAWGYPLQLGLLIPLRSAQAGLAQQEQAEEEVEILQYLVL